MLFVRGGHEGLVPSDFTLVSRPRLKREKNRWSTVNLKYLFLVTAFVEMGTGLFLLLLPAVPLALLLGTSEAAPETLLVGRVAGAALLGIGVASWRARQDRGTPAQLGLLAGILLYNVAAAVLLGFAGTVLEMAGVALWPAVVLHAALAVWCSVVMRGIGVRPLVK
jgi:hypothetical protein